MRPALRAARRLAPALPVSIDTTKAEVARRALDEGAVIVNDVSALRFDPAMAETVAPRRDRRDPDAPARRAADDAGRAALPGRRRPTCAGSCSGRGRRGLRRRDRRRPPPPRPGHRLRQDRGAQLRDPPRPPRPRFARDTRSSSARRARASSAGCSTCPVEDRLEGSLAIAVAAVLAGAHVVRVHDVRATVRAVRIADAILRGSPERPDTPRRRVAAAGRRGRSLHPRGPRNTQHRSGCSRTYRDGLCYAWRPRQGGPG